jgi:PAS domain S-box-containing protein
MSMSRQAGDLDRSTQLQDTIRELLPPPRRDLQLPVLPERADRLLGVLEGMDAFIIEFEVDGRAIYVSPNVESILGFTPEECISSNRIELHPDDVETVVEIGMRVRLTGQPAVNQTRVRHRKGHWVWCETTLMGWYAEESGGFHTITFNRDISELKRAEAIRRESEARYGVVSSMSRDLILEADTTGRQTYVGPGSEEVFGYTPDEMLAMEPWSLMHPDDVERVREQLADEFASAGSDEDADPHLMEYRAHHRDGRWLWFETLGRVYTRHNGERRFLAVSHDVTDRRLHEEARRELEESMQRAQKLESLGVLAGGIAHDFNNLLTPILGSAGLLIDELSEESPLRERLHTIRRAALRAAALTDQMLAYAGQRPVRMERVDLSKLVRDIRDLAASSGSGKTIFELELKPELPPVQGEAAQLSQVVLNLVTNASESLRDGVGHVRIRTGLISIDEPPAGALFAETLAPGAHVFFEVSDAGCGMDDETVARIFDPFFTTKFTGRGLGLAAVAGIVRTHHGAIEVTSTPGEGTCFRVLLPAASGSTEDSADNEISLDGWRASGTALVIDDDPDVRDLAAIVLERAGMDVLTAADGREGVKLFAQHADAVRVVLLDRTMPVLSGAGTLEAIRDMKPDAKIILVSGYSEEHATAELADRSITDFLQKPFLPTTLLTKVREALEAPAG